MDWSIFPDVNGNWLMIVIWNIKQVTDVTNTIHVYEYDKIAIKLPL